jgi:hypothetical protein
MFLIYQRNRKATRPLKRPGTVRQSAWCFFVFILVLSTCSSQEDSARVQADARYFKETAANETNLLLYSITCLNVQTSQTKLLRDSGNLMKDAPEAKDLQGFMRLAPELVGWAGALQLSAAAQAEMAAAIERSEREIAAVTSESRALVTQLAGDSGRLGSSKAKFAQALTRLQETKTTLEKFTSAIKSYATATDDLQKSLNAMLPELDGLSSGGGFQDSKATVARFGGLLDGAVADMKKMDDGLETERACKEAGLRSLLSCFTTLQSLSNLPPDLARELEEAIKLIKDVQN